MIWKEHWEVEHLIGQWDMDVKLPGGRTERFFAKDKGKGYAITKQMEYEGEWRVLGGVSDTGRLQES